MLDFRNRPTTVPFMFLATLLLRSATILANQPHDLALPLSQITDLCLLNNIIRAFSHLTVATALKSFTFHCLVSAPSDDISLPHSLVHENLRCLIFPATILSPLNRWSTPNLETLELYRLAQVPFSTPELEDGDMSLILQFTRRSRFHLRALRIFRPVRTSILRDLLEQLSPSLLPAIVITVSGAMDSELFRELGPTAGIPLQNVREFTLRISDRRVFSLFEDDALVLLVSSMYRQNLRCLAIECSRSQEMPFRPNVIERLTFLRGLKQQGLLASLTIGSIEFLRADDKFHSICRHWAHAALLSQ
ncbi:hypothetical protein IW262DRAFT_1039021 [Armillaria fumosa]|nr:hypothetical protein IW262DRAFT_1039021 [Armillaria fumosa]